MLYTRVTVSRSGSGWIAVASSAAAGDVQVSLQPSGRAVLAGTLSVTGSISGVVIHMPELLNVPTGAVRANFRSPGELQGVAFTAGSLNSSAAGLDGLGTGTFSVTPENGGEPCSASAFSWSIFSPQ